MVTYALFTSSAVALVAVVVDHFYGFASEIHSRGETEVEIAVKAQVGEHVHAKTRGEKSNASATHLSPSG